MEGMAGGDEAKRSQGSRRGSSLWRAGARPLEDAPSRLAFDDQSPRLVDRSPIFDGVPGDLAEGEPQRRPVSTPRERPVGGGPEQAPLCQAIAANNERLVSIPPGSDIRPRSASATAANELDGQQRGDNHQSTSAGESHGGAQAERNQSPIMNEPSPPARGGGLQHRKILRVRAHPTGRA